MVLWRSSNSVSSSFSSSLSSEESTDVGYQDSPPLSDSSPLANSTSPTSGHVHTNAVNRSLSDIHTPTWVGLIILNSSTRATIFHPIQLALARKRVVQDSPSPSVFRLIAAAHRGGVTVLPGMKTPIDFGPGGIRGLYRGYGAAFISSLIGESLYLVIFESIKESIVAHSSASPKWFPREGEKQGGRDGSLKIKGEGKDEEQSSLYLGHRWASAIAAIGADAVTLFAVTPIAVVVGRQMTSGVGLAADNPYRSISGTFRHLWHLHQPRAEERPASASSFASPRGRLFPILDGWLTCRTPVIVGAGGESGVAEHFKSGVKSGIETQCRTKESIAGTRRRKQGFISLTRQVSSKVSGPFWRTVYGVRGLYQGTSAALLRIPSSGLWWGAYTVAKEKLYTHCAPIIQAWKENSSHPGSSSSSPSLEWKQNWFLSSTDNPILNASASAIASAVTTVAVNPIAVVQIRLQSVTKATPANGNAANTVPEMRKSWFGRQSTPLAKHSLSGVARDIILKEGIRGFFKGTTTNTCIAVLDGIVFATMYELTKLGSDYNFLSVN